MDGSGQFAVTLDAANSVCAFEPTQPGCGPTGDEVAVTVMPANVSAARFFPPAPAPVTLGG